MNTSNPQRDPVPQLARQVLSLFAEALPAVRFPDLDISVLEGMSQELMSAQLEVERLEAGLELARNRLQLQADQLSSRSQRALAYARVFAEGNDELAARVAEVHDQLSPAPRDAVATKRRGRPRKAESGGELFEESSQADTELGEHAA